MRNKFNQIPRPKPNVVASVNSEIAQQIFVRLKLGLALHDAGQFEQAKAIYEEILKLHPEHFDSIILLGAVAIQAKQWVTALDLYAKALKINPNSAIVFCNQSIALKELKRYAEALASYDRAIELKHDYAEAYNNRGNVLKELKRFAEALASYNKAIEINRDYAEAHYNRGNVLNVLKLLDEALASYDKAIELKHDYSEAYSNRGNVLKKLNRLVAALISYDKAIELKPDDAEAYLNRGNVLKELKRFDEALISYDKAVEFKSDYAEPYYFLGDMLSECKLLNEELACYVKAIELKPEFEYLFGTLLHTKMRTCCWQEFEENIVNLSSQINLNKKSSPSFPVLGLIDSLFIQHKASEIWINDKHPFNPSLGPIPKYPRKEKIRIGYFSSDFHNHATAFLMAELFERHDKTNFECIAFSFGPDLKDKMRFRLMEAFDQFIDVQFKRDKDIASLSRDMNIDIAVDLKGVTAENNVGIFSYRAAPIQVNYIGYPGTMAAEYMDYIIADPTLIPTESQQHYSEKIVYLPNSYQVNDRKRETSGELFTKEELGLPKVGFVFCCFNNNYKITPPTFDGWIRILKAVEGSVLWLLEDNPTAVINLRNEASARGLDPNRLVFAKRMQLPKHLARHRAADLFIDTLPCNAHTTASDALWAGLPLLTCMGESFASRVTASLLNAIDLPELVTTTQEQYEALAIELATNPVKLKAIKDKLEHNRLTTALFDTPRYTLHIEAAYKQMYERYQAGLSPDHIYIEGFNDHLSSYNSVDNQ